MRRLAVYYLDRVKPSAFLNGKF